MLPSKFACAVFALSAGTAAAAALTDTNFNSTSVGSMPSTYTVSEAGGTVRIAGTPSSSNRSVFLNDTSTTTLVSASKTFTAQSGVVDAEFKFMQPALVNNTKVFRLLSGTTAAVSIETVSGALQYRGPNSVYTNILSGYVANRWYSLRIVANAANDTADVYINGVRKVTGAAFFGAVTSIDGFDSFTPNTSAGSHYLDDVVIKPVSTAIPGGALVVDFNGTGNYMTVGAAIAAIPADNTTPRVIYVKNGNYSERLNFPADKQNITLIGQSATGTILSCNDTSASAGGTTNSPATYLYGWMDTHICPAGWNNWGNTANEATARYSEFGNTGPGSSTSARVSWSHVLSSSQAAAINAQSVLARTDGWNPVALDP